MFVRRLWKESPIYIKQIKYPASSIQNAFKTTSTNIKCDELKAFQDVLPQVVNMVLSGGKFDELPDAKDCMKEILYQNVEGGKKNRGLTVVNAYEHFEKPENITEENLNLARIAGWCVEMMQAYFLINDDIMDSAVTRRGAPCWYRRKEIGLRAVNDAIMIKCSYSEIMKLVFKDKPYYMVMMELMNDNLFRTSIGQHLDVETTRRHYNEFTLERYNAIVKYKASFYTYNLPIGLGYILTNNTDSQALKIIEELSIDIGRFFQVQDDFIDLYGDPKATGKFGTDIQEGKCSWMAVTALQNCTTEQRKIFDKYYGSSEKGHEEKIRDLYEELGLREKYAKYEEAEYRNIKEKIDNVPKYLSPTLFYKLLDKVYRRKY